MASTVLTDINFLSEPFRDHMRGKFTTMLGLSNALLAEAPDNVINPNDTGYTIAIPRVEALSGSSVQITSATSTTINNLGDDKDIGIWIEREKAWGADQVLNHVAGVDLTTHVAEMLGEYWAIELQRIAVQALSGIFSTALASTHVKDDSSTTINVDGLLGARYLLGDNAQFLKNIVMNSKVFTDAVKDKIANYDKASVDSYATGNVPYILGMEVFQTDALTATASVYPSYIGSKGAMLFKFRNRRQAQYSNASVFQIDRFIEVELNRSAKTGGGQDELISRASICVHVPGIYWNTGSVTSNPTDAQLATGSSWGKSASDDKLIQLVQYKSL